MSWSTTASQIVAGDDVYGSDGDKVGTVAAVHPGYIVVEKGWFFPTDYYIPFEAVNTVDAGQVYLNVTRDAALHSGWDTVPDVALVGDETGTLVDDSLLIEDREYVGDRVTATEVADQDEIRIPVMEEELTATVRSVEAGAVRIEKDVVAEERVLEVPVTEEQVRVERRVVDRPVAAADVNAFQETVIEVPVTREEVELQKRARVAEEVVVTKEAVQRTEQVRGTVRREEVIVDEDAVIDEVGEALPPR
jgi:uncharacterized protein (TIGR02271 family)